ncbi:butyrophilin subfamily 1 member A1-like [Sinocyclocheilus grahami]|uniref:butyrophilin subfamily 1 member A1-like n=1 Tax=Sinocyclocheilus grahami TaxID=75366 RepID=UPI0007AC6AA6|nr:PREDICTED: butyrophilin subfamily 1 member A1-like [Sinocyclocheilus grahami]
MLSIIVVVNLLIETAVSFTVGVPGDPIAAHVGSTVILPCWISPPENAEALEIRWYRRDQFRNPVLLYNHGKIQDVQEETYRNRTSLALRSDQSGGLKDGDVSLRLDKLRVQDDGSFRCYVSGESSYGSEEVVLKITGKQASTPYLMVSLIGSGSRLVIALIFGLDTQPRLLRKPPSIRALRPGGSSHSRGADEMFSVHSWTAVSLSDAQLVSCSVSLRTGEVKEGRLNIQGIVSSDPSGSWKALFLTFLICALLGSVVFILYKYREKLTGKKPAKEICEEETMERLTKEGTNAEEPKKVPDCEEGILEKLRKKVVEDINIEELRKHAVEITIDREALHPGLMLSKDCKMVKDRPEYKHTGEGFPFELCASGAQRFTSGRHYWEVELALEHTAPKSFWLIGVVKHGHFTARDRSALTPSAGFWFLCSDGPHGFYTNTDPSISFSLTPRPERLGVLFDYDEGLLSFYNVTESKHLLTISSRFSGSVVPLFNPGVGDLSPLRILDCPKLVESAAESSDNPKPVESAVKSRQPLITAQKA